MISNLTNQPTFSGLDFKEVKYVHDIPESYHPFLNKISSRYSGVKLNFIDGKAFKKCVDGKYGNLFLVGSVDGRVLIKVKSNFNRNNIGLLESLLCYLDDLDVDIAFPLKNDQNELFTFVSNSHEYLVELVRYIDGRFYKGNLEALDGIASSIGRLHSALSEYCSLDNIKKNTQHSEENINETYEYFKECYTKGNDGLVIDWMKQNKGFAERLISDYQPVSKLDSYTQLIHGDLNRGNALICNNPFKLYILDFEDSIFSYLPLSFDLMFAIQRFILQYANDEFDLHSRVLKFFDNYKYKTTREAKLTDSAAYILRLLSYRSALKQVSFLLKGSDSFSISEMDKFVALESDAIFWDKPLQNCFS